MMRLFVALALTACLTAQDLRFDAQSRLVIVPVNVTDSEDRPVQDLIASDFQLLDNGRPRPVVVDTIGTGVAPIALVVAVQSSGISSAVLEKVRKVGGLIKPLITGERGCAALLTFAEHVEWRQKCTRDDDTLIQAFSKLRAEEHKSARMLDAVHEAVKRLSERQNVRRVLLLISESRDRGSETDLEAAVTAAQTAGVTVYAATYSAVKTAFTTKSKESGSAPKRPPLQREPGQIPMRDPVPVPTEQRIDYLAGIAELARLATTNMAKVLAAQTGGVVFSFTRQNALEEAIERLGEELNSQYVLSFTPEAPTPGHHILEVRVVRRGEFRVRARPGYWSAADPQ